MELKNKINWITTRPLTMEKRDTLILILKENNLDDLINDLYKKKDQNDNMMDNIRLTAQLWKNTNQRTSNELVN